MTHKNKKYLGDSNMSIFDYKKIDDKKSDNPAVLSTLEGYATLSGNKDNRNKHFYPGRSKNGVLDSFWDKVLGDNSMLKEKLETKTFFGSSRHPGQDEAPVPEFGDKKVPISHAIREYRVDDKGVYVIMDILNTEAGREIQTYIDYGSDIGISTRAFGEVDETKDGFKTPKLDNYFFITWDLVSMPAFSETRMKKVSDDMGIELSVIEDSASIEKFKNGLEKLPSSERKTICDYAGLDYSEPLSDKDKALDTAIDKIAELENKIKTLEVPQNDSEIKTLRRAFKKKIWTMAESANDQQTKIKELEQNVLTVEEENKILTTKIDSASKNIDEKEIKLESGLVREEELKEEIQINNDAISELRTQLNKTRKTNLQLVDKLEGSQKRETNVREEKSSTVVTSQVEALIQPKAEQTTKVTQLTDSVEFSGMVETLKNSAK